MSEQMNTEDPNTLWDGVDECEEHTQVPDKDCMYCDTEMTQREERLGELMAEGHRRLSGLAAQGMNMPPTVPMEMKLDLIIDCMFQDPRSRLRFEGEFGRRFIETLKEAQKQALTNDVIPKSGLHIVGNDPRV